MPGAAVKKEPPYGSMANGPSLRPATRNGGQKRAASYFQAPDSPQATLDSVGAADGKKPNIPGFLTKTFEIFSNDEYSDLCGWGENGDTIVIKKVPEFSSTVLPKYFKHSNFQSFVRQLNMYDFHKTVQDPSHGEFKHEFFKRGRGDLLCKIKRKVSQPVNSNKSNGELAVTTTTITPVNGVTVMASGSPAHGVHALPPLQPVVSLPAANGSLMIGADMPALGNKAWQRRVEQRLNGLEDTNRVLMQENQVLFHTVNHREQQIRTLKDCLVRLVGIMNEYTEGKVPAIQRLRTDLEHHLMPAPAPLLAANGQPAVPVVTNGPPALPPTTTEHISEAVPNGVTPGPPVSEVNGGQELSRTLSVEPFWRGQSLNSLPSFGGLDLDFSLSPDHLFGRANSIGFGRLQSLDRMGSTERAPKKGKYVNAEAQALQDQLEALKRNQANNFQRIDSLEQQLTSLFDEGELIDLDENEGNGEGEMAMDRGEAAVAGAGAAPEPLVEVNVKPEVVHASYGLPVNLEVLPSANGATPISTPTTTAFVATTSHLPVPAPAPALASFPPGPMEGGALVKQRAYNMVPSTPFAVPPVPAQESL